MSSVWWCWGTPASMAPAPGRRVIRRLMLIDDFTRCLEKVSCRSNTCFYDGLCSCIWKMRWNHTLHGRKQTRAVQCYLVSSIIYIPCLCKSVSGQKFRTQKVLMMQVVSKVVECTIYGFHTNYDIGFIAILAIILTFIHLHGNHPDVGGIRWPTVGMFKQNKQSNTGWWLGHPSEKYEFVN